ncbi:hypothetical protein BpHYR1_037578 [Brachionus plicatilis]|uniref:Uncharacterized protein n=1 Tax=Brachionus plicatilis TaxID=10195 RepID=A0A3M7T4E3_BRAPC|nr:hypothetical protein BpHYR1_037578 [Brachionus plicatilis]
MIRKLSLKVYNAVEIRIKMSNISLQKNNVHGILISMEIRNVISISVSEKTVCRYRRGNNKTQKYVWRRVRCMPILNETKMRQRHFFAKKYKSYIQDNDPKHTSNLCTQYLIDNKITSKNI